MRSAASPITTQPWRRRRRLKRRPTPQSCAASSRLWRMSSWLRAV